LVSKYWLDVFGSDSDADRDKKFDNRLYPSANNTLEKALLTHFSEDSDCVYTARQPERANHGADATFGGPHANAKYARNFRVGMTRDQQVQDLEHPWR
jgi:hypothetical protein